MRIRVCSDLHTDVNRTTDFGFNTKCNDVDLTIIAGDISGDYQNEIFYLSKLNTDKPVVCVAGNHLGYNYIDRNNRLIEPINGTKLDSINRLCAEFTGPIHYLENSSIVVNNKIVFGGTMYTNFNLYGNAEFHSKCGESGLNDFRYVFHYDGENVRPVQASDYIKWFNYFIKCLQQKINDTALQGNDIIVVTHFAPSVSSISKKYNGRYQHLNPSYASNLDQFILDNPRIKLWVHGHMHDSFDYKIGNCRVVCYPYGYNHETNYSNNTYEGKIIRIK